MIEVVKENPCAECGIKELYENCKDECVQYRKWYQYQQGRADALSIDMEKPMHFTDEQKAWIKQYIIINAKRQRVDVIDLIDRHLWNYSQEVWEDFKPILEQLKANNLEDIENDIKRI